MLQQSLDRLVDTAAWWTLSVLHAFTLSHISTTQNGSRKYLEKKKVGRGRGPTPDEAPVPLHLPGRPLPLEEPAVEFERSEEETKT